jgi:predicted MPP superfamily phosphohydrolase
MSKFLIPIISILVIVGGEYFMWKAIQLVVGDRAKALKWAYWILNISLYIIVFSYRFLGQKYFPKEVNSIFIGFLFMLLLAKVVVLVVYLVHDFFQLSSFGIKKAIAAPTPQEGAITRSAFLAKVALGLSAIPAITLVYGIVANAYNYQFKKLSIKFPNLPKSFDGFKIVQLSDIHSGSFTQTKPIEKVIDEINNINADLILFTGDLVNNESSEMDDLKSIFGRLKAKIGVMSVTGNHDYGDYIQWDSEEAKKANFSALIDTHKQMGWDLLMNEHRLLERNGEKIAILGIENWGKALHFPKYGKLDKAYKGTEDIPFKLLMSHDPSHWDGQVRPEYPDIDLTLSGHTHGFQFGVETKYFKWSPSQWVYKQWAGLYQEASQYIYVNRGFGFLGYPGRIGILPEITVIELKRA